MFEKVCQIAEQAATNVSRRGFLGRFGKGALMAAGALGAILASPGDASAGRRIKACGPNTTGSCIGKNDGDPCECRLRVLGKCKRRGKEGNCVCDGPKCGPGHG